TCPITVSTRHPCNATTWRQVLSLASYALAVLRPGPWRPRLMSAIRLLASAIAISASLIAGAVSLAGQARANLLATETECNGTGKACTHDRYCEESCKDAYDTCCQYGDSWTFYGAVQ